MTNTSDFIIENGVLKAYTGKGEIVTIPDGVTEIDRNAFYNCTTLKKLIMPSNVVKVGSYAFGFCTELEEIILSNKITIIPYQAFSFCSSLKKITISAGVTEIGINAFYNCTALQSIAIAETVDMIGCYAFYNCVSLQSITISDSVTSIGDGAFYNCNLRSIKKCYKAFQLNEYGHLQCVDYVFNDSEEPRHNEDIELCYSGYHYCTNLFEIFNYYSGVIDKDIAIYEIKPVGKILKGKSSSKCCCQSFKFKKRLYQKDIIRILNGGEI